MALKGIDVSNYQAVNANKPLNDKAKKAMSESDFMIVKATQGTSFVNGYFHQQMEAGFNAGKLMGIYHFANGGDPHAEAKFFAKTVEPYIGKAILCLDWESKIGGGKSNPKWGNTEWCKKFLDYLYEFTGVRGFVYVQASAIKQVNSCATNYGLWIAGYPDNRDSWDIPKMPYSTGKWFFEDIWQYTSSGGKLDRDYASSMTKTKWERCASIRYLVKANVNVRSGRSITYKKYGTLKALDLVHCSEVFHSKTGKVYGKISYGPYKGRWFCIKGLTKEYAVRY